MYLATVKQPGAIERTAGNHRRLADSAGWRGAAIGVRGRLPARGRHTCAVAPVRDRSGSRFSSPGRGYPDSGCCGEFIRTGALGILRPVSRVWVPGSAGIVPQKGDLGDFFQESSARLGVGGSVLDRPAALVCNSGMAHGAHTQPTTASIGAIVDQFCASPAVAAR